MPSELAGELPSRCVCTDSAEKAPEHESENMATEHAVRRFGIRCMPSAVALPLLLMPPIHAACSRARFETRIELRTVRLSWTVGHDSQGLGIDLMTDNVP